MFLDTLPLAFDTSDLRGEVERLRAEIDGLESELSEDSIAERTDSILSVIGGRLTRWAERLHLEWSGHPHRLDIKAERRGDGRVLDRKDERPGQRRKIDHQRIDAHASDDDVASGLADFVLLECVPAERPAWCLRRRRR